MGFFSNFLSKLLDPENPYRSVISSSEIPAQTSETDFTISYSYPTSPEVNVSDAEVNEAIELYKFVLTNEPVSLKTGDQWFEENTNKRRIRDGSKKAYCWLLPFLPPDVAMLDELKPSLDSGPCSTEVTKKLRALIREQRKSKQPFDKLLIALYKSCVMNDFADCLTFEYIYPYRMTQFVDLNELQRIHIDYSKMGYKHIKSLLKTDVKWLIENFGEPIEHHSFNDFWPHLRQNAISRYCWEDFRRQNELLLSYNGPQKSIDEWLREFVKCNLKYRKQNLQQMAYLENKLAQQIENIQDPFEAIKEPFVVADLETTGLDSAKAEIIELAALLVNPDGTVTSEFSMLVKPENPIPTEITSITNITQNEVNSKGQPLHMALTAFLRHIGERPVFFHNSKFDKCFLTAGCAKTKLNFKNVIYDTLPVAKRAWPSLDSHKLGAITNHIGVENPKHRALGDAYAALAVLLAARDKLKLENNRL